VTLCRKRTMFCPSSAVFKEQGSLIYKKCLITNLVGVLVEG